MPPVGHSIRRGNTGRSRGYVPAQSIQFSAADNQAMTMTNGGASSDRTRAFVSIWVKRAALTGRHVLWSINVAGSTGAANQGTLSFESAGSNGDTFNYNEGTTNVTSTRVVRDPSAHLHIYQEFNTNEAVAADRAKTWINGVLLDDFNVGALFSTQGMDTPFGQASVAQSLFRRTDGFFPFDGVGSVLVWGVGSTPGVDAFGEFDAAGVWRPIAPTADLSESNCAYVMDASGTDQSGNGNNWTPVNVPTDSSDVPADKASVDLGNYARPSVLTKHSSVTLTGAAKKISFAASAGHYPVDWLFDVPDSGKFYVEVKKTSATTAWGLPISFNVSGFSLAMDSQALWSISDHPSSATITVNGSSIGGVSNGTNGDVFQLCIDRDNDRFWFGKNDVYYDSAAGTAGNPATGANPTGTILPESMRLRTTGYGACSYEAQIEPDDWTYTAPTGFKPLCTAHLPEVAPVDPGAQMGIITYDGASDNKTVSAEGMTAQVDFALFKSRTVASNWRLYDSLRSPENGDAELVTNGTNAEGNATSCGVIFGEGQVTFDQDAGSAIEPNESGSGGYIALLIGGLTHMSAGEISSLVTATGADITPTGIAYDATLGMAIITYTGDGTSGHTLPNPLGQAPDMMIHKCRSNALGWPVYTRTYGATYHLYLNDTSASVTTSGTGYWNDTEPTSTLVTLGNDNTTNYNTYTYVLYLFCNTDAIKVWADTGNGSADGPCVDGGGHFQWHMRKRVDSTGQWAIWDTARDPNNVAYHMLQANDSAAESTSGAWAMDYDAAVVKVRHTQPETNASGGTYINLALIDKYFGGSNVTQGKAR